MNHREQPHPLAGTRKAWHCLSLLLLATALTSAQALSASLALRVVVSRSADPTPYLPATGAPPLRFQESPPTPVVAPPSAAPAAPVALTETSPTTSNPPARTTPSVPGTTESLPTEKSAAQDQPSSSARTPAPILPDDTRPTVRPEDFLPYFQIPGSARQPADVTLLVPAPKAAPAPAPLPPSSATYTQTPK